MNLRMQSLDATAHDFRKSSVLGHFLDGNAVFEQEFGGSAGRQELDAAFLQFPREFNNSRLIGDAEQRTADGREQWVLLVDTELFELLAQGAAIDAENRG